jgi:CDP-diacylglycerol--glycerol-3-phosphate 3-phosphatidyltransferase
LFDGRFRASVDKGVGPIGTALKHTGLSPDHLTALGLVMAVPAAIAIGSGRLILGLILLVASAIPDLLDGALAKASGTASARGAFFDSVADRVTDAFILGGIGWYLQSLRHGHAALLPFAILAASTLISYQRAKAESLGFDAKGGLMERAERIILLCIGLVAPVIMVPLLWTMLILTVLTAVQRFVKVWRQASDLLEVPPAQIPPSPESVPESVLAVDPAPVGERWRAWRQANGRITTSVRPHRDLGRRRRGSRWEERRQARLSPGSEPVGRRHGSRRP